MRLSLILKWCFLTTLLFSISSCGKWKSYCCSKCDIQTKDSVWQSVEYICVPDTFKIPYHEISWDTTFNFEKNAVFHRVIRDKGLTGTLDINKGKIGFKCESDSLNFVIEKMREIIKTNSQKQIIKTKDCDLPHKTKWNYFCTGFFWLVIIVFAIWALLRYLRAYFSGR